MIRTSDSTKFLVAALAEFHKAEVSVPKAAENPFFHSRYADLWTIKFQCEPHLNACSLLVTQFPGMDEAGHPTLITRLCHASGEYMEAETRLYLAKDDPQAQGSAITYMRRYAYCAVLGIVADPDDDGEKAMQRSRGGRGAQHHVLTQHPTASSPPPETQEVNGEQIPLGYADNEIVHSGPPSNVATPKQVGYLKKLMDEAGVAPSEYAKIVHTMCPPWPDSLNNLSKKQASVLIEAYK